MTTEPTAVPTAVPPTHRRRSMGLRFLVAFLVGTVLAAGVGTGALYAYGQQYTGKVLPGVRVGSVDLSGLPPAAARQAIDAAYGSLGAGQILLNGPDGEITIGYGEIGRRPDTDAMLAAALAAGRRGHPVADLVGLPHAAMRGTVIEPTLTYDPTALAAAVTAVGRALDREPVDATLVAEEDGTFAMTASVDGRVVDQAALLEAIAAQVGRLDAPAEIRADVPLRSLPPSIDTGDAQTARAAGERMAADLVLTRGNDSWTLPGPKLRKLVSFRRTVDGGIAPVIDVDGIDPMLKPIANDVDQAAANATFKLRGNRVVVGSNSREGRRLDAAATRAVVVDALLARQAGVADPPLEPVVAVKEPAVTTAEARSIAPRMRAISKWTTWFPIWERNGFGANIWLPARAINGYVVGPGETFDFWKAVGTISRAKGYRDGGAIINGRTEPQGALAGGICSTSTTLFNAAMRAGYDMGARRNHYYYIDRYPMGLDATVFISGGGSKQTMSWTNDTDYPVLIRGVNTRSGGKGYVTFVLYTVPNNRKVSIGPATIKNVRRASMTYQKTSSLPKGHRQEIESVHDGMDVWRTVTVRENGKVIRRTTYYSHYSAVTGITLVGTGGGDTQAP